MVVFLDPGQMTARLELEDAVSVSDGQGGATVTWQSVAAVWAMIEPVSFVVTEAASAEVGTVSHRIWIRFRSDVAAGQRLIKGARISLLKLVRDPDETGRYLVCQCEEQAP